MYLHFYGLSEKPFSTVPDSTFFFKSRQHVQAYNHLLFGITSKEGFIVITGEVGTGKTTLCRALLQELDEKVASAYIFNPPTTAVELLKTLLHEFGEDARASSKQELLAGLNKFLLECSAAGKQVVVVFDEAQNLSDEVLEEVRLLSNLETTKEKLLQIILSGQVELHEKLAKQSLKQLRQRISLHYHLSTLAKGDVKHYIQYRLYRAGSHGEIIFNKQAISKIYKYSGGIPRVINLICDKALLAGYAEQQREITKKMVQDSSKYICCQHNSGYALQLKLAYGVMGIIITGLFIAGIITGDWYRLIRWDRTIGIMQYAEARIPETLLQNRAQAVMPMFDPQGIMRQDQEIDCSREALATMLKLWGIPDGMLISAVQRWKHETTFSFCDMAKPFELKVSSMKSSIEQIKVLDYPCIVRINAPHHHYTVLAGIGEDKVVLLDSLKGKVTLSLPEFQQMWSGKAFSVWKDFGGLPIALRKGESNAKISSLKRSLKAAGLLKATDTTAIFDESLETIVKNFQEQFGLKKDGILGNHTKMALYRVLYPMRIPSLQYYEPH